MTNRELRDELEKLPDYLEARIYLGRTRNLSGLLDIAKVVLETDADYPNGQRIDIEAIPEVDR